MAVLLIALIITTIIGAVSFWQYRIEAENKFTLKKLEEETKELKNKE